MSNKLNFSRNIALEKEELIQFQNFLINNSQKAMFEAITSSWGIIPQVDLSGNDFLVEQGTTSGSIKISNTSVGIDIDSLLLNLTAFDNYPILNDSIYYWVKVSHRYLNVEPGTISVNTSGEVAGTNTEFTELLRNQTTGSPIKIKFYKENVQQVEQIISNDDVYEIVEIINDGSMILAGDFVSESSLRYIIIGSAAIGTTLTTQQKEGIYSYNNCTIELVPETTIDTPPVAGFTQSKDFYIARVRNVAGVISIEDKRSNYYWSLDLGVALPSKAERDATNINSSDALLWLDKLMAYQNSYVSLTASSTPTSRTLVNTEGLIYLSGSSTTFSYTIKLPSVSIANKGKLIVVQYDLNSSTSGSSYIRISDISGNILFTETWAEIRNKRGIVVAKNNGSIWKTLNNKSRDLASTNESLLPSSSSVALTPAGLRNAFTNSIQWQAASGGMGVVEKASTAETQAGTNQAKYITPYGLQQVTASTLIKGLVEKATTIEAQSGAADKYIDAALLLAITGGLITTVLDIGDWNMDTTTSISITHGLTLSKIRTLRASIRNDGGGLLYDINQVATFSTSPRGGSIYINPTDPTKVSINRINLGLFDSTEFDSTSYNRGWIVIQSTP